MKKNNSTLFERIETEINNYMDHSIEISDGVDYSQYKTINRLYKFRNKTLTNSKIKDDLSYDYYYDIISPRVDSEVKNLRFDTKHILTFSRNPRQDFAAVFIANAKLKEWMAENGEDDKLKAAVEEFSANGNIGFKKVDGGYEFVDPLNTYITNQRAESVEETAIIERHEMSASQLMRMSNWDNVDEVIEECGDKSYQASDRSSQYVSTSNVYEIFEYTGEISEKEYNDIKGIPGGDEYNYFLAKVIIAGLQKGHRGKNIVLFCEKFGENETMSDYYIYAHRGRYEGRFWRVGMYELLFDYQIRANEIGNQIADGLSWAAKAVFKSKDSRILQNIRADIENGDIIITDDLMQVDVRLHNLDQLIADWNRLTADADRLSNSFDVVRGDSLPSGTAFRLGALMDQNAGRFFVMLRQKITLPYKRVFREWLLQRFLEDLKGEDIFRLTGNTDILDSFREIMVENWYMQNLVKIGPHTKETAEAIKAEKLDEMRNVDPVIENSKEIWKGVLPRLFVTITGENSDIQDQLQDLINLVGLEQDPDRIAWILDTIYKARNIPIPPRKKDEPAETQLPQRGAPELGTQDQLANEAQQPVLIE